MELTYPETNKLVVKDSGRGPILIGGAFLVFGGFIIYLSQVSTDGVPIGLGIFFVIISAVVFLLLERREYVVDKNQNKFIESKSKLLGGKKERVVSIDQIIKVIFLTHTAKLQRGKVQITYTIILNLRDGSDIKLLRPVTVRGSITYEKELKKYSKSAEEISKFINVPFEEKVSDSKIDMFR